ncbi:MAG: hypothetical protein QXG39_00445 [Candidatus Aenigmatarchaeota archaeon]
MTEHYQPRKISSISKTDSRIALIGKVVEVFENSFLLEDETGRIEIFSNEGVKKDDLVRVFCSQLNGTLKCEFVQNLKGFDLNLFKKVEELYKKEGLYV